MSDELKAFDSFYDLLQRTLNPDDVAGGCLSNHIISSIELEEVQAAGARHKKTAALLGAVQRGITLNQAAFYTFLEVLTKEPKYTGLVDQLRKYIN